MNFIKLNRSIYSIVKLRYLDRFIGNTNRNHSHNQSRGKVPDRDSPESNKKRLRIAQSEYKFIAVLGDLADNESLRDGSLKALHYGPFFVTCGLQCDAAVGYFIYPVLTEFRKNIRNIYLRKIWQNLMYFTCLLPLLQIIPSV